jgi:hypothetical protein
MSQSLSWSLDVAVINGPQFSQSQAATFDAYDKIDVVVPAAGAGNNPPPGAATVEVQPGGAGQVQFLLLTSSVYDPLLTFKVDGGAAVKFDAPLLLAGAGAVALLGATQKQFAFSNALSPATAVTVSILVGRKATV